MFRSGGNCPAEGCVFAIYLEAATQEETDLVAAAAFQTHADLAHGGAQTTFTAYDGDVALPGPEEPAESEERPRLVN